MRQGENRAYSSVPSILYMPITLDAEPTTEFRWLQGREPEASVPVVGVRGKDCGDSSSYFGTREVATTDTFHMTFDLSAPRATKAAD